MVVDTSALMAIVMDEPQAEACIRMLADNPSPFMSAVTLAECLIVAAGRDRSAGMEQVLGSVKARIDDATPARARSAADAYARWGKGVHPARLNFVDCFAYALARERGSPLLYVGADFAQTDVASALPGAAHP